MKNVLLIALLCGGAITACQADTSSASHAETIDIRGVWDMTHRYFYEDGKLTETLIVKPENRQVKIYTQSKFMWSSKPRDSKDWHAYGNYSIDGETLTETKDYAAQAMAAHSSKTVTRIEKTDTGFKQIFSGPDNVVFYAETFTRIE